MRANFAAVIGSPIGHSLSPVIHRAAFAAAGVDWSYAAFDVEAGRGAEAVGAMRLFGFGGLSVTMPHKADVAAAVDRLDAPATTLRSVNTLSWDGDELVGSSTDGPGFIASLADHGIDVSGAAVVVIGAGGAARSIIDSLSRAGADRICVINRSAERAEQAAALAAVAVVGSVAEIPLADIVINATSVGMGNDDMPCPADVLQPRQVVAELVYHPLRTAWLDAATLAGARTIDGLGMLIHQAALQQELWLGSKPDIAVMRAAAESSLAPR